MPSVQIPIGSIVVHKAHLKLEMTVKYVTSNDYYMCTYWNYITNKFEEHEFAPEELIVQK